MHPDSTPSRFRSAFHTILTVVVVLGVTVVLVLLVRAGAAPPPGPVTPAPAATVRRQTPTPAPTRTPAVRRSIPTTQPRPADPAADYRAFITDEATILSASLTRTSGLLSDPRATAEWDRSLAHEIAIWNRTRDEVVHRTPPPPPAYAASHRAFLSGLDHFVASGDLLTRGVETGDDALIAAANAEVRAGIAAIDEATRLMKDAPAS